MARLGFDFDGGNGRDDDTVFGLGYGLNGCLGFEGGYGFRFCGQTLDLGCCRGCGGCWGTWLLPWVCVGVGVVWDKKN
jgi:hypothetical protein